MLGYLIDKDFVSCFEQNFGALVSIIPEIPKKPNEKPLPKPPEPGIFPKEPKPEPIHEPKEPNTLPPEVPYTPPS